MGIWWEILSNKYGIDVIFNMNKLFYYHTTEVWMNERKKNGRRNTLKK